MPDIPPPTVPVGDDNRHLFCQMAIEIPLHDLIHDAENAGWEVAEVLTAIIEVADSLMLAHGSHALNALLKAIKRNMEWPKRSPPKRARTGG
jgi:hypothetical protein